MVVNSPPSGSVPFEAPVGRVNRNKVPLMNEAVGLSMRFGKNDRYLLIGVFTQGSL